MKKKYPHYKILVVEDNPGDFELINSYLKLQIKKLEIQHATSFYGAKAVLKQEKQNFDVILLDLSLPDLSGEQLTKEFVSISEDTPIIVLTGYENLEFSIKSLSMGIADYLLKDEITPESLFKDIIYSIERKRSNLKIKESEKRYSDLFHFSPQPIIVYDIDTLKFLSVNQATIDCYGFTEEELLSMSIKDVCIKYDENLNIGMELQQDVDHSDFNGLYKVKRKDGVYIDVDAKSNTIEYQNRKARLVLVTDITERLQYIREIKDQNKKLQDIAYTQSHIVRAPLVRIMTIVNLMEQLQSETEECRELLEYIIKSGKELDYIIKDIVAKTEGLSIKS